MAEWFCKEKTDSLVSLRAVTPPLEEPPPDVAPEPSFYLEPDRIAGLGEEPPTPEDELVTIILSSMAGYIMKQCETKDCMKRIDLVKPPPPPPAEEISDEEEMIPLLDAVKTTEKKSVLKPMAKRKSKITGVAGKSPATKKALENKEAIENASEIELDQDARDGTKMETVERRKTRHSTSAGAIDKIEDYEGAELKEERGKDGNEEIILELEEAAAAVKKLGKRHSSLEDLDRKFFSWRFRELDQMADIDFIHKNKYNGRMSRMLMEDFGKFTWNNGQSYKGTFKKGFCHGHGIIEWNAQSIYEGQVHCNLRHGTGVKTYVDLGRRMYHAGMWKHGKKDGKGISVYDEGDWYDGEWVNGQRMGVGTRRYKNGMRYHGQWLNGMRHGKGTMVWPNNDIYMGEWHFGQMHGRGKYTWNSFMNEGLLPPMTNTYTGEWCQNKRHGDGVLELMTGGVIKTKWYDDMKSGAAQIICRNGNLLQINDLFINDRVAPVINRTDSQIEAEIVAERRRSKMNDNNFVKIKFHNDEIVEDMNISEGSTEPNEMKLRTSSTPIIPINAPVHTMDFTPHINKLFEIRCTSLLPLGPSDPKPPIIPTWEKRAITWLENKWLQKVVIRRMGDLTKVYNFYSLVLSNLDMPQFKFCLHRMSLWLLMEHCGISETGLTVVRLDEMVGSGHDPFDKVMMYEMINYLMTLSWLRYVPVRRRNTDIPGIIAACFDKFIEEVVRTAPLKYDGKFHQFLKFTPFECLNNLYSTFDYPVKIEDLCARLLYISGKDFEDKLPFPPPYYKYILKGKNIVGPDGYLSYIPYEIPHFDLNKMKLRPEAITPADFRVLGLIGIPAIVRCIKEAVPGAINPINDELESEYELSFNDFCYILVNLVTMYLDMSEEYYRKIIAQHDKNESAKAAEMETANDSKVGEGQASATSTATADKKPFKKSVQK